ncbi:2Fe-2S iron-sulfur cluster-binding protein [Micromonospora sp. 4G57]|uniref:2Fe-2S iron-sulfur cluster-binding protein n=1 Tax=Micromonospora sicca TaxID=2202420 RepID=A0ABU5JE19_9ACTN|nr:MULTISPECIES: 2Fe-2S iron-sulfur cluster-binding protein [unclassified Micromonospora]MDZ5445047.1 2Fe-2S iron-sulfur cluster-binding protein [Micromonospora sp. 4G57]MDZ5490833.1 2Fe-2S iron-sulfur cluster-binding protein [Micromonospora sp. 4G53]
MPKVTFVTVGGTPRTIDATVGDSVMVTAVRNGVRGIVGECGGNSSCATCHVYVDEDFLPLVGPANDLEDDMLDLAVSDRRPTSRLSCQITVTEALDGLTVELPDEQP